MKFTLKKLKKKISRELKNIVYHNYSFRPSGLHPDSKTYVQTEAAKGNQVFYKEIYPDLLSELHITPELYNACSSYFKPNLKVRTSYVVVEIPKGRVHTDNASSVAIISADNRMIGDVSFSYTEGRVTEPSKNNIFHQKYFDKPHYVKGTVFSMLTGGSGLNNYSHWLIDVLPSIHLLKESGLLDKIDWFLVPSYKHSFQKETLSLLGIGPEKVIEGEKFPHIQADTLVASTAPRGIEQIVPYWLCDFLKDAFLPSQIEYKYPPYVYVSRKDSKFRVVANEDALTDLLKKHDFKTFVLSDLSFQDKVNLFAGAKVIVSATGAGMTNMLFCKKGTKVVELFNEGFVVGPFYDMASKLELDYHFIISKTGSKAKNLKQGQEEDLVVDLTKIDKLMNVLFSAANPVSMEY